MPAYMILGLKYHIPERMRSLLRSMSSITVKSDKERISYYTRRFELFSGSQKSTMQKWFSYQRKLLHTDTPYSEKNVPFLPWEYESYQTTDNNISPLEYLDLST